MKKTHSKAFSLIELSIVILVVGVLIAGVMQGTSMVRKSQLQTARNLTTSSPVSGVKDLMLWYETSLESSFKTTEAADSTQVSVWYDNNTQSIAKNSATQGTPTNQPKFIENVFGAIPAIRFDGSNDRMSFDGTFLVGISYTIFVVEQRRATGNKYFVGCSTVSPATNGCLALGYSAGDLIVQSHFANDLNSNAFPSYSSPVPRMHSFWLSKTVGKKYWSNSGKTYDKNTAQTGTLVSNPGAYLGGTQLGPYYYNGDLAEVIIFARDLKDEERQAIEDYLSKKYNITITG